MRLVPLLVFATLTTVMALAGCSDEPPPVDARTVSQTFTVEGMTCSGCEQAISAAVARVEGVSGCTASHAAGTVTVTYDAAQADGQAIAQAINALHSYKVTGLAQ
jgi:copper chaperone CopZ